MNNNRGQAKQNRKSSSQGDETETYLVQIEQFEPSYHFSLNHNRERDGLCYSEYIHPVIKGKLIAPVIKDVSKVEVTIITDKRIDRELELNNSDFNPIAIGSAQISNHVFQIWLSLPFQSVAMLVPSLIAGQFELLAIHGRKLKYRKTLVSAMHLEYKYHPENY